MRQRGWTRTRRPVRATSSPDARARCAPEAGRTADQRAGVRALLDDHVIIDVVEDHDRYVLLGRVAGRPLIAVVADDELDDATVLVSVYEADAEHGWTTENIDRTLRSNGTEEPPR